MKAVQNLSLEYGLVILLEDQSNSVRKPRSSLLVLLTLISINVSFNASFLNL